MKSYKNPSSVSLFQNISRIVLGTFILGAGIAHLTFSRKEFSAQVPPWVPIDVDSVVIWSGIFEIILGGSLIVFPRYRVSLGWVTAAFLIVVFPGNIAQWANQRDGFGLDTNKARTIRLFVQPLLIALALWSTGAFKNLNAGSTKKILDN